MSIRDKEGVVSCTFRGSTVYAYDVHLCLRLCLCVRVCVFVCVYVVCEAQLMHEYS